MLTFITIKDTEAKPFGFPALDSFIIDFVVELDKEIDKESRSQNLREKVAMHFFDNDTFASKTNKAETKKKVENKLDKRKRKFS